MIFKGGDFIYKRQLIYDLPETCLDNRVSMGRTLNAIPESGPIDICVNDIPFILNIEYKELTTYRPALTVISNVKYCYSGDRDNILLEIIEFPLQGGQLMTFALVDFSSGFEVLPIIDDINEKVAPDETKVRVYNLDASNLLLTLGKVSRSLSPGTGTEYIEISPGRYELLVQTTSKKSININLNPGRIYTIYILGSMNVKSPGYSIGNIPQVILAVDGNTILSKCE
jgi:hypothetical protein